MVDGEEEKNFRGLKVTVVSTVAVIEQALDDDNESGVEERSPRNLTDLLINAGSLVIFSDRV